jgi:hypothetical protein
MAEANDNAIAIRPRTTGEILDDAIRLYQCDALMLLAFSFIFLAPAGISLLLMLCEPRPQVLWLKPIWPLTTAALFSLTGLNSTVCQEIYQRRSQGEPVTLAACFRSLGTIGPGHVALRAVLLVPYAFAAGLAVSVTAFAVRDSDSAGSWTVIAGALALVLVRVVLGPPLAGAHPALSSNARSVFTALGASLLGGARQPGKATVLVLVQIVLFAMAVLNLQLFLQFGLDMVSSFVGLETAFVAHVLSLGNPVYVLSLLLLVWVVMNPLAEAVQFLFHADGRARHEGLDLWFRVGRSFPVRSKSTVRAGTAVAMLLLLVSGVGASDVDPQAVTKVREQIHELSEQRPYPGGMVIETRLRTLARDLDAEGSASHGDFRWFYRDLDEFHDLPEKPAREKLKEIEQNLGLIERNLSRTQDHEKRKTREDLKSLLPPPDDPDGPATSTPPEASAEHKPVKSDNEAKTVDGRRGARGPTIVGPAGWGGLGSLVWTFLGGLAVLAVVAGLVLLWRHRPAARRAPPTAPSAQLKRDRVAELAQMDPQTLWREADRLAREGNRLEALRHLYAALLGLLHRGGLIKLDSSRTNGEHVRQLQRSCPEPSPMPGDFAHLTETFERKWYGEKACQPDEYDDCRGQAEQIRDAAMEV